MAQDPDIQRALDLAFQPPKPEGTRKTDPDVARVLDSVLGPAAAKPATTSALMKTSGVNPDEELTRRNLAQQLGKPAGLLPPTPQAQQALRDKQNAEAVAKAPKLATWLEKPENAAISADDIPHLAKVETSIRGIKHPQATAANVMKSLWNDFSESFVGAVAGLHSAKYLSDVEKARNESGLAAAEQYLKTDDPARIAAEQRFAQMAKDSQQKLEIAKEVYRGTEANKQAARPEFETNLGESTYDAISGLAVSAPPILAAVAGTVAAGPAGGLAAASAMSFAQTQSMTVGKYVERGATFKEAMVGSGLEGAVEAGFAALPMGYVVGKLGGKTGVGSFMAGVMLREVPTEMATFVAQSAIDTAIANPNKSWAQWQEELPEGLKQTAYQAFIGSALMASPHAVVRTLGKKTDEARVAEQTQTVLEDMNTLAQESATRNRSPEDYQNFLETLQEDAEVADAFVDAKVFADALQTPQGQALASAMPDITQRVQEALATSGDVRMPIAQYATHIAGGELFAQLSPVTKLKADGLTYAQAEEHYGTLSEQMKEAAAAVDSMRVLTREEFDAKQQAEIAAEQAQPAAPKDRRAYTPEGERIDRRQDPERRKTIDETLAAMATPEERETYLRKELFTDKMTGLGNRRAYEEATPAPLQLSIDADSLKWINDNMSPDSGDAMLTAIGQALKQLDLDAYHISGDEFMVQGDNEQDLRAAMDLAQDALKNATIVVERPDGTIVEKKGVDITYGIGKDKAEADYKLKQEKVSREAAGLRAGRGQEPGGISRRAAEREQDQVSDVAAAKAPRQTYEEYLAQHPNQDALFEADVREVEKTLREQIVASKRFRPEISEAYMKPLSAWYATHAKMIGVKPTELYARYPLKVVEQMIPGGYAQKELPAAIEVNGVQRPTSNSEGRPLAATEEGVRNFWEWFGDSKTVDADGRPLELYHGTTADFTQFERSKAAVESDMGAGFYFSNERGDVGVNYAGYGPDFTNKLELRTEQLFDELENTERKRLVEEATGKKWDELGYGEKRAPLRELALKELGSENAGLVMPVSVRMRNPVILGGKDETVFTYDTAYDEETDEYGEPTGTLVDFIDALHSVATDFGDTDVDSALGALFEKGVDNGISASELFAAMKESEGLRYATDDASAAASTEIIRRAFEYVGFDGIIDNTVNEKFGTERKLGKPMEGMTPDTVHFIAFNPEQIKSSVGNVGEFAEHPDILAQGDRGAFNPSNLTITLLRGADLSTFIHESGHFFLEAMADMAYRPDAPLAVQKDFDKVLAWFGIKDRETWATMTLEEKRPYHEQWAESYERWNLEGKAPTAELRPIMARFRAFMLRVYKSVEEFIRRNPASAKLNDDIRAVFSRMLAAENAIAEADQAHAYTDLSAAISKIDPKAAEELNALNNSAHEDAVEYVAKKGVADMKWLSKAKNKYLRELQKEANTKRAAIREEVTQEVTQEPVYAAMTALKGKDSELKLHTGVLHELMPDLDVAYLRGMTSTTNGTHPDQVADMFGYKSTGDLVEALTNAEDMDTKIDGLTDQRMLELHGELIDARAVEHAANLAVHNEARARFMATGLKALSKSQLPASQLAKAAKEAAEALIAGKKIRDVKPAVYEAAELKANRDVLKNIADPMAAADYQKAALLNNRLVKSAHSALEEVDKGIARMRRLEKKAAQENMRGEFLVQLNALLDRFDLRTSVSLKAIDEQKQAFKDWLAAYADDLSAIMPDVPEWIFAETYKKHYKDLTVEEFRGLMDTVKGLELLARREEKQYQAIRDMSFKDERSAVLARIREFNPSAFDTEGEPKGIAPQFVQSIKHKGAELKDKAAGEFLNAETIANILEGGNFGQVHESLIGRISKRLDWKAEKIDGLSKEIKHLFKAYSAKERYDFSRKEFGKIGNDPITRENLVIIALLHGNKEGRERLANYGWSVAEQQKAIGLLADKDKALVEGIWKTFDHDLWPQLKELNERTRGKAPPKVDAAPFTIGGKTWTGGYFRLKYDTDLDERAQRMSEGDDLKAMFGGSFGMGAKTAQGASTQRKDGVQMRPRLDLGVFSEAVSETVHDLALREAAADTMRLLNNKGIQNAIKNTAGAHSYRALVQRVRDVAARPRDPTGFIERTVNIARKNTVVALMSGLGTALQNVTGLVPAMTRVNPGRLAKEIAGFWSSEHREFAFNNSAYMRGRSNSYDRSLLDEARKLQGKGNLLPEVSTMLWFMSQTDKLVSVPVWHAAYADGMAKFENDHDKSVEYADHVVRQTQGAGRDLDVSNIMDRSPLRKMFTMFYSYFNSQLGQLVRSGAVSRQLAKQNRALAVALFTKDFLLVVAIPAMLSKLIFSAPNDEEEDKSLAERSFAAIVQYGLGMVPLVRDAGNFALQKWWPEMFTPYGNSYKMSPIVSAVEGVTKVPGAVYDIATGEGTTKDQKDAIMGVSYAFGLPGKLISNTWTGTQAVLDGESPSALIYGAPYKPE